jgi:hypothetical protein
VTCGPGQPSLPGPPVLGAGHGAQLGPRFRCAGRDGSREPSLVAGLLYP